MAEGPLVQSASMICNSSFVSFGRAIELSYYKRMRNYYHGICVSREIFWMSMAAGVRDSSQSRDGRSYFTPQTPVRNDDLSCGKWNTKLGHAGARYIVPLRCGDD